MGPCGETREIGLKVKQVEGKTWNERKLEFIGKGDELGTRRAREEEVKGKGKKT